jgi:hypothetical protein
MGDERDQRSIGVDRAQRRREMRNSPTGVGRTVEWIDHDHDIAIEILRT